MNIMSKIEVCGCKISSATKFIDFFVHDILDYTLLNEKEENFMPNNTLFNLETSISEIKEILIDKIKLKAINIDIKIKNFDNDYIIKTDQKRMQ